MALGHITGKKHAHAGTARSLNAKREPDPAKRSPSPLLAKRADEPAIPASCSTGSFYTSPKMGTTIDALAPLTISWDPACMPTHPTLDIYLIAAGLSTSRIYYWQNVPTAPGSYAAQLKPRWWQAKQGQELQVTIVGRGQAPYESVFPAGPVVVARWTEPTLSSGQAVPEPLDTTLINLGTTVVQPVATPRKGLSGGQTAAAVLVPLLALLLAGAVFFRWKRKRTAEKRRDWAEKVDKRMSTISTDWKSVSVAGAQAAIRNSIAVNGRNSLAQGRSSFAFGNIRPGSAYGEGEFSGNEKSSEGGVGNTQKRPGVGLRNPSSLGMGAERVSRVSFANDPRPSSDSRRTKTFRDSYVPPVPTLPRPSQDGRRPSQDDGSDEGQAQGTMSPTQTVGAMTLTPEDIRARIAAGRARADSNAPGRTRADSNANAAGRARKTSFERDVTDQADGMDVLPALKMMRTGTLDRDEYLLSQPAAAYSTPKSIINSSKPGTAHNTGAHIHPQNTGSHVHSHNTGGDSQTATAPVSPGLHGGAMPMPMHALPASVMSPDDMLRAYAERKKSVGGGVGGVMGGQSISHPLPMNSNVVAYPAAPPVAYGTGTPRTLFNGSTVSPHSTGGSASREVVGALGFAPGEYDAHFSFGNGGGVGGEGLYDYGGATYSQADGTNAYGGNSYGQNDNTGSGMYSQPNQTYGNGSGYGGYDAAYGGAEYAIGEDEEDGGRMGGSGGSVGDSVGSGHAGNSVGNGKEEAGEGGFAGRGAFGRR